MENNLVQYVRGTPNHVGVYACRVPMSDSPMMNDDKFLMWDGSRWYYCRSDQRYRGEVLGFIGPLERRMK